MRARTLALVGIRWALVSHCIMRSVAATSKPALLAAESNLPSSQGEKETASQEPASMDQLSQGSYSFQSAISPSQGHKKTAHQQLASFDKLFEESFRLQSGTGVGDLASAVEGFDFLTRQRRGPAWQGHNIDLADYADEKDRACWENGDNRRAESDDFADVAEKDKGRVRWNGSDRCTESDAINCGGEDNGVGCLEAFMNDASGRGDGIGGGCSGVVLKDAGGGQGNEGVGWFETFLEAKEGDVREFFTRSQGNFALATEGEFQMPALWGPDVFSALTRGSNFITALHKLDHDREQLEYLIRRKRLPQEFEALAKEYGAVRETIATIMSKRSNRTEDGVRGRYYAMGSDSYERLRGIYNSLLHVPREYGEDLGGTRSIGPRVALNPELDWEAIEKEYLSKELPLVWFDGFLAPDALEGVLEYCREATVFFDVKIGYLGAYLNDGLSSPWLVQIARELQQRLPRVLEGMSISNIWAYKFDSDTSMNGITVHADVATVNLNFWVTPDDANLDPSSGGLVVYPKEPPHADVSDDLAGGSKMDATLWNNFASESFIKSWLKTEGVYDLAVTIPYRQNRVVMFDSRLLHETDTFRFREGYENRRINLTFLFSRA